MGSPWRRRRRRLLADSARGLRSDAAGSCSHVLLLFADGYDVMHDTVDGVLQATQSFREPFPIARRLPRLPVDLAVKASDVPSLLLYHSICSLEAVLDGGALLTVQIKVMDGFFVKVLCDVHFRHPVCASEMRKGALDERELTRLLDVLVQSLDIADLLAAFVRAGDAKRSNHLVNQWIWNSGSPVRMKDDGVLAHGAEEVCALLAPCLHLEKAVEAVAVVVLARCARVVTGGVADVALQFFGSVDVYEVGFLEIGLDVELRAFKLKSHDSSRSVGFL